MAVKETFLHTLVAWTNQQTPCSTQTTWHHWHQVVLPEILKSTNRIFDAKTNMVVSFPLELDGPIDWDPIPLIPSYCNCTPCKNCVVSFGGMGGEAGWIWNGWINTPYHPNQQGKPSADTWGLYGSRLKISAVTRTPSWILLKGSPEHSNSIQCCLHLAAG